MNRDLLKEVLLSIKNDPTNDNIVYQCSRLSREEKIHMASLLRKFDKEQRGEMDA